MCVGQENIQDEINVEYTRIQVSEYTEQMFASHLPYRDKKPKYISKFQKNLAVMASDGLSPHSPSLHLGLPGFQPPRRHHAQSLLGPSFHDPTTPRALESNPKRAAPLSHHDDERRHAVSSHCALALRLYLAACNPSSSCCF